MRSCTVRDMATTRKGPAPNLRAFTFRIDPEHLEQLREIAAGEHRSIVQQLRVMVEREIAAAEEQAA